MLDANSQRQLDDIKVNERLDKLEEDKKAGDTTFKVIDNVLTALETRIKVLEDARLRQIELNEQFHTHSTRADTPTSGFKWTFWK